MLPNPTALKPCSLLAASHRAQALALDLQPVLLQPYVRYLSKLTEFEATSHRAQPLPLDLQPVLLRLDVRYRQVVAHVEQVVGGEQRARQQLLGSLCGMGQDRVRRSA